jgi:hypothetical protein
MALWRKKPVSPASFDAVLIGDNYFYAGPDGQAAKIPKAMFEAENEPVPLERAG